MKKTLSIFFVFYCSLLTFSQVDTMQKEYAIKYCKITYEFFNGPSKGTRIVIFDDWGMYEKQSMRTEYDTTTLKKRNTPIEFFGSGVQNELIINTPTYIYQIDLISKTGGKIKIMHDIPIENVSIQTKKKIGEDTYLGKKCDIVLVEDSLKLWIWNGISIKKEMVSNSEDKFGDYAIEIDEKYIPTKSDFEVPKDIIIE